MLEIMKFPLTYKECIINPGLIQERPQSHPCDNQSASQFYQINDILIKCIEENIQPILVDMPQILLRMKICKDHKLQDLEAIFNKICNKIVKNECIPIPGLAAQELYPEIFVKPVDDYLYCNLRDILPEIQEGFELEDYQKTISYEGLKNKTDDNVILAFTGNYHVDPFHKIWMEGK